MKLVGRCPECGTYTLKAECPHCSVPVTSPDPPRYSPEDRWSKYRRALIMENRRSDRNG